MLSNGYGSQPQYHPHYLTRYATSGQRLSFAWWRLCCFAAKRFTTAASNRGPLCCRRCRSCPLPRLCRWQRLCCCLLSNRLLLLCPSTALGCCVWRSRYSVRSHGCLRSRWLAECKCHEQGGCGCQRGVHVPKAGVKMFEFPASVCLCVKNQASVALSAVSKTPLLVSPRCAKHFTVHILSSQPCFHATPLQDADKGYLVKEAIQAGTIVSNRLQPQTLGHALQYILVHKVLK